MPAWIVFLRRAIRDSKYIVSEHALKRMGQRGITFEDIERCVIEGEVIDKQAHGKDVKWILRGATARWGLSHGYSLSRQVLLLSLLRDYEDYDGKSSKKPRVKVTVFNDVQGVSLDMECYACGGQMEKIRKYRS